MDTPLESHSKGLKTVCALVSVLEQQRYRTYATIVQLPQRHSRTLTSAWKKNPLPNYDKRRKLYTDTLVSNNTST